MPYLVNFNINFSATCFNLGKRAIARDFGNKFTKVIIMKKLQFDLVAINLNIAGVI